MRLTDCLRQQVPNARLEGAICAIGAFWDFLGKCFVISRRGNLRVNQQIAVNQKVRVNRFDVRGCFVSPGVPFEIALFRSASRFRHCTRLAGVFTL